MHIYSSERLAQCAVHPAFTKQAGGQNLESFSRAAMPQSITRTKIMASHLHTAHTARTEPINYLFPSQLHRAKHYEVNTQHDEAQESAAAHLLQQSAGVQRVAIPALHLEGIQAIVPIHQLHDSA